MSLFLSALNKTNTSSRPPIWLMRQAGRYMPSYQKVRKAHGLNPMFHRPDLIIQTTMMPIELLDVDAAILFADILTVVEGLNKKWTLVEGVGPVIEPLTKASDLQKINPSEAYPHISLALTELKKILKCPLIGFAGGPLTVAAYLIEGKMSKEMQVLKSWIYKDPQQLHQILETITEATIDYLQFQINHGVNAIQIFDSWAGMLTRKAFREFSLPYLKKIFHALSSQVPMIIFSRGACLFAEDLCTLQPQAISFDWQIEIEEVAKKIPENIAIQGNLDPSILLGSQNHIRIEIDRMLNAMKGSSRYIFNLGHGILPQTPFENVQYLVDYVKSFQIS